MGNKTFHRYKKIIPFLIVWTRVFACEVLDILLKMLSLLVMLSSCSLWFECGSQAFFNILPTISRKTRMLSRYYVWNFPHLSIPSWKVVDLCFADVLELHAGVRPSNFSIKIKIKREMKVHRRIGVCMEL